MPTSGRAIELITSTSRLKRQQAKLGLAGSAFGLPFVGEVMEPLRFTHSSIVRAQWAAKSSGFIPGSPMKQQKSFTPSSGSNFLD